MDPPDTPAFDHLFTEAYRAAVDELEVGKRLPSAVYLHRSAMEQTTEVVWAAGEAGEAIAGFERESWDVVKPDPLEPKISLLAYPTFFEDPHPVLQRSVRVDLAKCEATVRLQDSKENAPVLQSRRWHPSGTLKAPLGNLDTFDGDELPSNWQIS